MKLINTRRPSRLPSTICGPPFNGSEGFFGSRGLSHHTAPMDGAGQCGIEGARQLEEVVVARQIQIGEQRWHRLIFQGHGVIVGSDAQQL